MFRSLSPLYPVLARELECDFSGFGSAAHDVGAIHAFRSAHNGVAQLLDGLIRECRATHVCQARSLARHRLADLSHAVADGGDIRATNRIEVSLSVLVLDPASPTAHSKWIIARQRPVKDWRVRVSMHS